MKNNTSTPVQGEDFMFRDYEKKYCINSLKEENSLLLLGIRRTGKSSLLKEIARLMREEEYLIIEIDCQDKSKPSELFLEILKSLPKDSIQRFTEYLKLIKSIPKEIIDVFNVESISGFGVDIQFDKKVRDYWIPISKSIEKNILENDKKIILFLDELPYFFENLTDPNNQGGYSEIEVKQILATLRSWRNERIQMVLCGSLNISYFLNSKAISEKLLAGLNKIDINLYSNEEAKALFLELARSRELSWVTDEVASKVVELVQDNVPFFIQTFFSFLSLEKECSNERLAELYETRVYPNLIKNFIYQFNERLAKYSIEEMLQVEFILNQISINPASYEEIRAQNKSIELNVFLRLINDEFIKPERGNKYSFSLNIVHNWWKEKSGLNC